MSKKKQIRNEDLAAARNAMLLLTLINALQPVPVSHLRSEVAEQVPREAFETAFTYLLDQKLVKKLKGGACVATWRGVMSLQVPAIRIERDVLRMKHLWEVAKRREEPQQGDDSSSFSTDQA